MSIRYRPEIDGLRAIAVLIVLLCHAGVAGFGGGFVGVDVFFVISGFLITSLIVSDLKGGTFSFTNFWERRIRRILPPLALVVLATTMAGWFLHLPSDYDLLGQQVAAQSVFGSNILFKLQAGYFDKESIIKPLLHTWSLAVEEQFYLLFPLAAFLVWKYRRDKISKYLWIAAGITFVAAAFLVRNSPSSAFYLLPFRAWELLIGSLLAVMNIKTLSAKASEALGFTGLTAILLPTFYYTEKTMFPGATALAPCLGAACIIYSNTYHQNFVGKILAMRGPVFIGLVSYSLYLWHWPIISFVKYSQMIAFTPLIASACLGTAFVLAILTWNFLEKPIRRKVVLKSTRQAYVTACLILGSMAVGGLAIHYLHGIPGRLSPEIVQYAKGADDINPHRADCNKPKFDRFEKDEMCQLNTDHTITTSFIVWGDSYADAMATVFYDLSEKHGKNGYIVTAHGCPPILGFAQKGFTGFDCPGFNERVLAMIDKKSIKHVVLIANWTDRILNSHSTFPDMGWFKDYEGQYDDVTTAALQRTVDVLQQRGIKVYMMFDVPYAPFDPPRYLAMKRLYNEDALPETLPLASYMASRDRIFSKFLEKNKGKGIVYLDPKPYLCDENACRFSQDGTSLYFNEGHLSTAGSRSMTGLIEPYFKKGF